MRLSHDRRVRLPGIVVWAALWAVGLAPAAEDGPLPSPPDTRNEEEEASTAPEASNLVETIVVSATRAEERRDAVAFTTVPRERIEETNRGADLAALLADTPNAFAYSDAGNGIGYSYLSVRGFRQEKVATYLDGVPLNTPDQHAVYFIDLADLAGDLEAFQVQRGTGTSLYGSPAFGGVVSLESRHLDPVERGEIRVGAGSFGTWRVDLRYGGPLAGGRWAWMVRAAHVASDGYRTPSWTRHSLYQFGLERFGRDSVLRIRFFGGPEETQLSYYGVPIEYLRGEISGDPDRDRRVNFLRPGETDTFFQPHLHVLHDVRIAEGLFLRNTWFGIVNRGYYLQYSDLYDRLDAPVLDAWRKRELDGYQVGWIPRITWDHAGGTLSAGLFLQRHTMRHAGTLREGDICVSLDPDDPCAETEPVEEPLKLYGYRNRKITASLFVRDALRLRPDLVLTLEMQGTRHEFRMGEDRAGLPSARTAYSFATPRAGIHWNASDRWSAWASASAAASEPTFDAVWDPQTEDPALRFRSYDPARDLFTSPVSRDESLRQLEAGFAYRAGTTRLRVNVYRLHARDELVPEGGLNEDGLPITVNAGRTVHRGLELEGGTRLPGEVDASAYFALQRDTLQEFVVYGSDAEGLPVAVDQSGNRIASFPAHTARLRVRRTFGRATIELGARRLGTIFTDNSEDERKRPWLRAVPGYVPKKLDPSTVVDARASVDLARLVGEGRRSLRLDLWVENVLDRRYVAMGYSYPTDGAYSEFYTEFFPATTRSVFAGLTLGF